MKKPAQFKVWAAIDEQGKLRHVRQADYREPARTLRWLGYVPAILTLQPKQKKPLQKKHSPR